MNKISLFLSASCLIILASCGGEDEQPSANETEVPAAEAKATLSMMSDNMKGDVVSITQSEGVEAVLDLLGLFSEGFFEEGRTLTTGDGKFLIREKARMAKQLMVPGSVRSLEDDGSFDFESALGVYEWHAEKQEFVFEAGGEAIIVRFPTKGSATNNAILKVSAYEEVLIEHEGERSYYPSQIAANLVVDEEELVKLLVEIGWTTEGEPESADISLLLKPYTFTIAFDDKGALSSRLEASIDKQDEAVVAASVEVHYASANRKDVELIEGFVSYLDLRMEGDIDVPALDESEDGDPNDYVHLSLFASGKKLGHVIFIKEEIEGGLEDWVPYIQYNDESVEKLEDILKPVLEEAEAFFEDLDKSMGGE